MKPNPEIRVRPTTRADAERIRRVLADAFPNQLRHAYPQAILARALPLMTRPNSELLSCGTYYLAEICGETVGCGGWTHEEPGSGKRVLGTGHLRHFAVASSATRQGVGRALFQRCVADARQAGVKLLVCDGTLNAEPFYVSVGFTRDRLIDVQMTSDFTFPAVRMTRALGGQRQASGSSSNRAVSLGVNPFDGDTSDPGVS